VTVTNTTTIGSGPNGPWIKNGQCQTANIVTSTATSGTTTLVLHDTSQSFTVNEWSTAAAALYDVTRGNQCNIASNTANTVTCSAPIAGMSSGDSYQINVGSSPIPENWQYQPVGWLLTDPAANGDNAWASPGSKGFDPRISGDRTRYGVMARVYSTGGVGYQSEQCMRLLDAAVQTSTAQTGTIPVY